MKKGIVYSPELSIKQNAEANKVSESAVRKYIRINGIDRKRDNAIIIKRGIKELVKTNPNMSLTEIAKTLHHSVNTIKKYLNQDSIVSNIDTSKVSVFDISKRKFVVSSVSENQDIILNNILRLYIKKPQFQCDLTYSIGVFYRSIPQPLLKYDKYPQSPHVLSLEDFYAVKDSSIESIIYDLPFIIKGDNDKYDKMMDNRFDSFSSIKELYTVNEEMLHLAHSKLMKKGYLVVKTMDLNYGGKQQWVCNFIQNKAKEIGFNLMDLFILTAKNKVLTKLNHTQRTARKFHS